MRRDDFEARDEVIEAAKRFVLRETVALGQILAQHAHGFASIAHFMRQGRDHQFIAGQELVESAFLAVAQFVGGIDHDRRQPFSFQSRVSREPNVRQKNFAAFAIALALCSGAQSDRLFLCVCAAYRAGTEDGR